MSNMLLANAILSDAATLTGSSVAGGLPLQNLQRSAIGAVTRFLTTDSCYVVADMGVAQSVDFLGLLGHNASVNGGVRVRAAKLLANLDTTPDYDSGNLPLRSNQELYNILEYRNDFYNGWSKSRSIIVPEVETAPDGTLSMSRLVATAVAGTHSVNKATPVSPDGTYTESIFVKKDTLKIVRFRMGDDVPTFIAGLVFDCDTGTVLDFSGSGSYTITDVGDGVWQLTITGTVDSAAGNINTTIYLRDDTNTESFTGDGVSGVLIWNASLVEGTEAITAIDEAINALDTNHFLLHLAEEEKYRYWRFDMTDPGAAYLDVGRLYIGKVFEPETNMSYGLQEGFIDPSTIARTAGGRVVPNERPVYRYADFELAYATEDEVFGIAFDLDRLCGTTKDVLFVQDPANKNLLQKRTIYGNMRSLSPVINTSWQRFGKRYRVEEIIS